MSSLHIAFQDGFAGDTVIVVVNGVEWYSKPDVSTNLAISLADTINVEVKGDKAQIKISVPSRGAAATLTVDAVKTPYVGVSIKDSDRVEIIPSKEPFRYF
jgi:hypothetical protein